MVSFGLKFVSQSNYTNDEIFNMYYQSYEANGIVRSASTNIDQDLSDALALYNDKKYNDALVLFNQILDKDYSNISVHLYAGISNMESFSYKKAIESFQLIIDHQNNLYVEQAEWYMAICYLKMYQNDVAKSMFEKIAYEDSSYQEQAKDILKKL